MIGDTRGSSTTDASPSRGHECSEAVRRSTGPPSCTVAVSTTTGGRQLGTPDGQLTNSSRSSNRLGGTCRLSGVTRDDLTPFQAHSLDALAADGIPSVADLNDFDENCGAAPFPTNTHADGVRINSAFGYVDPMRDRPGLTVIGNAPAERVRLASGRVEAIVVRDGDAEAEIRTPIVVVSGGAYGSPALLLRSGVGPATQLDGCGVPTLHELPGVGENLHDQPTVQVDYAGSAELSQQMRSFLHRGRRRDEQVIAKFPSSACSSGFDLHIFPIGGPRDDPDFAGRNAAFTIGGAVLSPLSRGSVSISGPRLKDELLIDHQYLTDPEGSDLARLVEVVEQIRAVAAQSPLRSLIGAEVYPGSEYTGRGLAKLIASTVVHYYHPAGSCKMGPPSDSLAVVDHNGAVHGVDGLFVGDASIMPAVVSGNTNMPTIVIGEKLGRFISGQPVPAPRSSESRERDPDPVGLHSQTLDRA